MSEVEPPYVYVSPTPVGPPAAALAANIAHDVDLLAPGARVEWVADHDDSFAELRLAYSGCSFGIQIRRLPPGPSTPPPV